MWGPHISYPSIISLPYLSSIHSHCCRLPTMLVPHFFFAVVMLSFPLMPLPHPIVAAKVDSHSSVVARGIDERWIWHVWASHSYEDADWIDDDSWSQVSRSKNGISWVRVLGWKMKPSLGTQKFHFPWVAGSECYPIPSLRTASHSIHTIPFTLVSTFIWPMHEQHQFIFDCTGLIICYHVLLSLMNCHTNKLLQVRET